MRKYFKLSSNVESEFSRFKVDGPLHEHFHKGILFGSGIILKDVFPATTLQFRSRTKNPDYLEIGPMIVASERLGAFFVQKEINVELLEVSVEQKFRHLDEKYYCVNFLDVIACMDYEKSEYQEFRPEAGGGILNIDMLYLNEAKINNSRLFIMEERVLTLVREDLVNSLRQEKFTGIEFKELPKGPF